MFCDFLTQYLPVKSKEKLTIQASLLQQLNYCRGKKSTLQQGAKNKSGLNVDEKDLKYLDFLIQNLWHVVNTEFQLGINCASNDLYLIFFDAVTVSYTAFTENISVVSKVSILKRSVQWRPTKFLHLSLFHSAYRLKCF